MDTRVFLKRSPVNTWEPIKFEDIKANDQVKMIELSPDGTEALSVVWDVVKDTGEDGTFSGHEVTSMYIPVTAEIKEMFKNDRTN